MESYWSVWSFQQILAYMLIQRHSDYHTFDFFSSFFSNWSLCLQRCLSPVWCSVSSTPGRLTPCLEGQILAIASVEELGEAGQYLSPRLPDVDPQPLTSAVAMEWHAWSNTWWPSVCRHNASFLSSSPRSAEFSNAHTNTSFTWHTS